MILQRIITPGEDHMATKTKKRAKTDGRHKPILALKGSDEYKRWLDGFAVHRRAPVTVLIEQAILKLAREEGYEEPPPRC
jgi:hypothetical protein